MCMGVFLACCVYVPCVWYLEGSEEDVGPHGPNIWVLEIESRFSGRADGAFNYQTVSLPPRISIIFKLSWRPRHYISIEPLRLVDRNAKGQLTRSPGSIQLGHVATFWSGASWGNTHAVRPIGVPELCFVL